MRLWWSSDASFCASGCSRPGLFGDQFHGFSGSLRLSARSHIDLEAAPVLESRAGQRLRRFGKTASRIPNRSLTGTRS